MKNMTAAQLKKKIAYLEQEKKNEKKDAKRRTFLQATINLYKKELERR